MQERRLQISKSAGVPNLSTIFLITCASTVNTEFSDPSDDLTNVLMVLSANSWDTHPGSEATRTLNYPPSELDEGPFGLSGTYSTKSSIRQLKYAHSLSSCLVLAFQPGSLSNLDKVLRAIPVASAISPIDTRHCS